MYEHEIATQRHAALLESAARRRRSTYAGASTSARIRSRVVRMPFRFVRPLAQPSSAQ